MKKLLKVLMICVMCVGLVGCSKSNDNTSLSSKEVQAYLEKEGYEFEISDYTATHYVTISKDNIWIQKIENQNIGDMVTFSDDKVNEEHASILNQEENETKDLKEQYDRYLDWLNEMGLEKRQIIDVLDYCDENANISADTGNITADGSDKAEEVYLKLKNENIPVAYYINYSNENDLNEEATYIGKLNFVDSAFETEYDEKEPSSGTIEVFLTKEDLVARIKHLNSAPRLLDNYGNYIIFETTIIRLNKGFTTEKVESYAKALNITVFSYKGEEITDGEVDNRINAIFNQAKNTEENDPSVETPVSPKNETSNTPAKNETPVVPPKVETPATPPKVETPPVPTVSVGQKNALSKAHQYLNYTAFSYSGLIKQLEYEKFSKEDATYAVNNCGANWNEQAAKKAQAYINYTSFSHQGLIDQLLYEGFTQAQAEYGVAAVGY